MGRIKGLTSRPKKKKVLVQPQPAAEEPLLTGKVDAAQEDRVSPTTIMEEEIMAPELPPSPGAEERAAAKALHEEAVMKAGVLRVVELKAKAEETRKLRLCEAREKRMDDVKKPNRKKSPNTLWNLAYRRLNNVVEQLEAKYIAQSITLKATDALINVHASEVCVLRLEIARLKRELRRTKK